MDIITLLSHMLGINTGALVGYLALLVTIANLLGRTIPDSATGWLGTVRKVAKVIGFYVGNRITPGVSANEIAAGVVGLHGIGVIQAAATTVAPDGSSPADGTLVPNQYRTDPGKTADSVDPAAV